MANRSIVSNDSDELTAKPIVAQPWEDYDAVLRNAERARVSGDRKRAHSLYVRLIELNPNDSRGWVGLSETATSTDEALIGWAYVLALVPDSWEARMQMDAHIEDRIAKSGITDAGVLVELARTLGEIGQRHGAHRLLERATELDPTNINAWLWRAGVTDDKAETIDCLQQALALDPDNQSALEGLRWASADKPNAMSVAEKNAITAAELFEEGQQALRDGNTSFAHDLFTRATELDPQNESAWFWRGSLAVNTDEALDCMEHALALNPASQTLQEARWWLRIKKSRENLELRANTSPAPIQAPPIPMPASIESRKRGRNWLGAIAVGLIILALIAIALAWQLTR